MEGIHRSDRSDGEVRVIGTKKFLDIRKTKA